MDFELNEDQRMLAQTVADFAKNESPVERFRKLRDDDIGYEPATWRKMGELGWLSIPFSEEVGGFGGTFLEVAVLLEEFGKELVPEPVVEAAFLPGRAIELSCDTPRATELLTPLATWEATAPTLDFQASDCGSGVQEIVYVLDGSPAVITPSFVSFFP